MTETTKLCKYCKSEINAAAKVCPHCRRKQGWGCLMWGLVIFGVLFLFGLIVPRAEKKDSDTVRYPGTTPRSQIEFLKITSTDLIQAFDDNQVKCKNLYDGKFVEVSGKVTDIREVLGITYTCLGSGTGVTFVGVQCYAKDKAVATQMSALNKGDYVTMRGKASVAAMSIDVKNAEFVEP